MDTYDISKYIEDKVNKIAENNFVMDHYTKFQSFRSSYDDYKFFWCNIYIKIDESKYIMEKLVSSFDIHEALSNIRVTPDYRINYKVEFV